MVHRTLWRLGTIRVDVSVVVFQFRAHSITCIVQRNVSRTEDHQWVPGCRHCDNPSFLKNPKFLSGRINSDPVGVKSGNFYLFGGRGLFLSVPSYHLLLGPTLQSHRPWLNWYIPIILLVCTIVYFARVFPWTGKWGWYIYNNNNNN